MNPLLSLPLLRGLVVLAVSVGATQSSANTPSLTPVGQYWLEHYYENNDPERFVSSLYELSRNDYFAVPGNVVVGMGFLASVFRQHPDYIDEWMRYSRLLPERERRLIISALWTAGHPKGDQYLTYYANEVVGEKLAQKLKGISQGPRPFDEPEIQNRREVYFKWGIFLATGDEELLRTILVALTELEDLTDRDRWWLACAAARHDRVMALCKQEISHPNSRLHDQVQLVVTAHKIHPTS
jgi:hypothetical protein